MAVERVMAAKERSQQGHQKRFNSLGRRRVYYDDWSVELVTVLAYNNHKLWVCGWAGKMIL